MKRIANPLNRSAENAKTSLRFAAPAATAAE